MKNDPTRARNGFTLLETVIAIAVLSVLLTGFVAVFTPAAAGIRRAINIQDADRLSSALEKELTTLRDGDKSDTINTGFDKSFEWLRTSSSATASTALLLYRYRGSTTSYRTDGTPTPVKNTKDQLPGKDYVLQTVLRKASDTTNVAVEFPAVEGTVYTVVCRQWIYATGGGSLIPGKLGEIQDPKTGTSVTNPDEYPEASISFSADFFALPSKTDAYLKNTFKTAFPKLISQKPVFSRNLAVLR